MRRRRLHKAAFTFVELLIVLVVIGLVATSVYPSVLDSTAKSRESALKADLHYLRNAVELFKVDTGLYPMKLTDLAATQPPMFGLDSNGFATSLPAKNFYGPYISQVDVNPVDRRPFRYSTVPATMGHISAAPGTALNGTNFANW